MPSSSEKRSAAWAIITARFGCPSTASTAARPIIRDPEARDAANIFVGLSRVKKGVSRNL
jgi:hypothetical protein